MTTNIKKEIGEKIKRYRKKCGLTQEQLAENIDISTRNLSNIELGISYPKPETLEKILDTLNITTQNLFSNEHLKSKNELICEIYKYISKAENNQILLEKIYIILKTLCNDYD